MDEYEIIFVVLGSRYTVKADSPESALERFHDQHCGWHRNKGFTIKVEKKEPWRPFTGFNNHALLA